ncbi:MAG: tRNA pseudouridine(38-40) synthase TruA [Eubacteriales bacterium]
MQNYRVVLQYIGSRYQGWQKQESTDNTIQGKLEELLKKMTGKKVEVHGSGRTDSGVHAYGQVASFSIDTNKKPKEIMEYMNFYLPDDIAVIQIDKVAERFHARLNAKGKVYRYRVLNTNVPSVFDKKFVYQVPEQLNMERMKVAAKIFCGKHDFKAFTSNKRTKKSTVRTIENIEIERSGSEIVFTFTGNGFLYHMVRIMMGTLLEVGKGERAPEEVEMLLENGKREDAGALVPALGLALMKVTY